MHNAGPCGERAATSAMTAEAHFFVVDHDLFVSRYLFWRLRCVRLSLNFGDALLFSRLLLINAAPLQCAGRQCMSLPLDAGIHQSS
jgi:hypothetical protein